MGIDYYTCDICREESIHYNKIKFCDYYSNDTTRDLNNGELLENLCICNSCYENIRDDIIILSDENDNPLLFKLKPNKRFSYFLF